MNLFEKIIVWLICRNWPIWAMVCISSFHLLIIFTTPVDVVIANKIISACMQIIGGLVVISSINSNLGLFRNKSIVSLIVEWWTGNPFRPQKPNDHVIGAGSGHYTLSGSTVAVHFPSTVEQRIAALERITLELQKEIEERHKAALIRIAEAKNELIAAISSNQSAVLELSEKVEIGAVGGIKQQAFGVMLAAWGAGTSVFA